METVVIVLIALAAFAVVLLPLRRRGAPDAAAHREFATTDDEIIAQRPAAALATANASSTTATDQLRSDDAIEHAVLRYRDALRAGTLCARCGQANPPDSAYCGDCGKRLPLADAKEFE